MNYLRIRTAGFNIKKFCLLSVFMCFVWIWEQTAIISLHRSVFKTEKERVYCAVRVEYLNRNDKALIN